jgi:hypothetical protein
MCPGAAGVNVEALEGVDIYKSRFGGCRVFSRQHNRLISPDKSKSTARIRKE